jgi:hypothetical protein
MATPTKTKKKFKYGDWVLVKTPYYTPFYGMVYSEYNDGPGTERTICVQVANGC